MSAAWCQLDESRLVAEGDVILHMSPTGGLLVIFKCSCFLRDWQGASSVAAQHFGRSAQTFQTHPRYCCVRVVCSAAHLALELLGAVEHNCGPGHWKDPDSPNSQGPVCRVACVFQPACVWWVLGGRTTFTPAFEENGSLPTGCRTQARTTQMRCRRGAAKSAKREIRKTTSSFRTRRGATLMR